MRDDILKHLHIIVEMRKSMMSRDIFAFLGYEDLIARMGVWFGDQALPAEFEQMTKKQCFQNAYLLARDTDLIYCEGYADRGLTPMHHAWCIDELGNVVDPTWDDGQFNDPSGSRFYVGLALDFDAVESITNQNGTYGCFAPYGPHPLLMRDVNWRTILHPAYFDRHIKQLDQAVAF